jgi:hypothetical protein
MRLCDITIKLWEMRWVLSDLYYADIYDENGSFCSWDSNHNDVFCEIYCPANESVRNKDVYIDNVDLYPDVGIGRLPCRNIAELDYIIEKIIRYETMQLDVDLFHTILLMGGDTFTSSSWADCGENEGEIVCEQIAEILPEFNAIKLYTSSHDFHPININRAINSGAGFIGYSGHGFEFGLGTHPTDNDRLIMYYTPYLLGLNNKDLMPICFFCACLTAKLDFNIGGYPLPCFAYSFMKQPRGGSIACIGSTQLSYGWVFPSGAHSGSPYLQTSFWNAYEPGIYLSDMFTAAQNAYLHDLVIDGLTLGEFILIGDPSLKIGGYPLQNMV